MIVHNLSFLDSLDFGDVAVLSFDVFDTLITRAIDPPEYVKRLVGDFAVRGLQLPISPQGFYRLRKQVESEICACSKNEGRDGECSLTDVYASMVRKLGLREDFASKLLSCELEVEKTYGALLPETKAVISDLADKHNLVAVSDTYLPVWMLRELLKHHGLDDYFSNVYVSCEYGLCKGSGRLFRKVMECEGLSPHEFVHIGDNFLGDYFAPRSLGIKSILLRDHQNLRRKIRLAAQSRLETRSPLEQSVSFATRLTAVQEPVTAPAEEHFYRWGRVIVGPLLCNYIHILSAALSDSDKDVVYFIAREGYLLKKLYKMISGELYNGVMPKARYLCVSRYTAFLASLCNGVGIREVKVALSEFQVTPQAALTRFGIAEEAGMIHLMEKYSLKGKAEFSKDELTEFLLRVLEDGAGRDRIDKQSSKMHAGLTAYLEEEGFFSARNVALADVGWFGGIQDGLEKAYSDRPDKPAVHGYYLALEGSGLYSSGNKTGFVHDFRNPTPDGTSLGFFKLAFEFSCRAPHGTTTGYAELAGGRVVPLFKRDEREKVSNPAIAILQRGVLDCARQYVQLMKVERVDPCQLRDALLSVYDKQVSFPSPAMAEAFRTIINTEDFGSDKVKGIADTFCSKDFFRPKQALEKLVETPWREATLMALPIPGILSLLRLFKRILAWRKMWLYLKDSGDGTFMKTVWRIFGMLCSRSRILLLQICPYRVFYSLFLAAGMTQNVLESILIFILKPLPPSIAVSVIVALSRIKYFFISTRHTVHRVQGPSD